MSRRQIRNRARNFARAIELETLEVRQLLSSVGVLPDFTVTGSSLVSTTVSAGDNDHIDFTVQNIGTADAQPPSVGNWYDAVIATTDATFDPNSPNDKYLSYPGNPTGLDIGASYTQGADFGTGGWAPGTYNIFVMTDGGNWVTESNEDNNVSTPVVLTVNSPDLSAVVNSAVPTVAPSAGLGEPLTVNWTVTNSPTAAGSTSTNGWTDVVWISPNPTLDTSDTASQAIGFFGNSNTSPVLPGGSYTNTQQVNLPTNIAPGTYYIFVQTNQYTFQVDTNPSNNISTGLAIQVTAADLVVAGAQADSDTHNAGDTVPISWTVANQGNAVAEGVYGEDDWHDAVYWSYSPTFDDNAHWIGDVDYSNTLAVGASYATPQELNVDTTNWDGGQYYFFVRADWYGWQEPESNENNNVSNAIPVTLNATNGPDLTVALNSAGATSAQVGSNVEVNFTVQNSQSATASTGLDINGYPNTWFEAVWLSRTPNLVQGDATIINYWWNGNRTSGSLPLNPGDSYTQDGDVTIPSNIGTGQYYLIVTTDQFSQIPELNGANNVSGSIPIQINGSDLQLDDFQVNGADANYGNPYDLGEIGMNTPFTVQFNVSNQGNETTQNTYSDAVYISTSQTFDPANSQLLYYSTEPDGGPLDVGDSYQINTTLSLTHLPAMSGTYYLFAVTDAFGDEPEGNEINNVSEPIQIEVPGPDLAVTSATVDNYGVSADPNTVFFDQPFNVSWSVDNNTDQSINNGWNDSVYVSSSSTFDPSNATQLLTFSPESSLSEFGSYGTGTDFNLNSSQFAPGQYYIFVVTDDGNQVAETNESNNIATIPITVQGADLVVTNASVSPTEANVGDTVQLNWTVQNQGESAASNGWWDEYYLSTSPTFDSNARDLGGNYEGIYLNAGDSYSDSTNIDLSNYLHDGGPYYLFVVTDNGNNQGEDNENNNVSAPVSLTLDSSSTADLTPVIDTGNTDSTITVGGHLNAQWTDNNIGTSPTSTSTWNDQVWLSPTSTFDPSTAINLGSVNVGGGGGAAGVLSPTGMNPISANPIIVGDASDPSIDGGTGTTVSHSFEVPENIGFGTFYLFVQTDVNDNEAETTNTNNISTGVPVTVQGSDLTVTASLDAGQTPANAPDGSTVYAGGLTGYYYGTGSNGANNISDAENYITGNAPLAQFVASQVQYPANDGFGSTEDDSNTLANFLGTDAGTLNNQAVKSNQLSGQIMEFDGYISLPAGATTLYIGADDGAELFLNGDTTPFIGDTGPHPFTWDSNTFDAPSAGLYAVKIIYYEEQGGTGVGLAWNDPTSGNMVTIPSADLYSAAPVVLSNQQFTVNWTGTNNGNISTQNTSWYDAVYISNSPVFDPSTATFLGNQYVNPDNLNIGGSYDSSLDLSIPGSVGGGQKYLFVSIDDYDYEHEGNEDNNISAAIPIIVGYPDVDLEPTSFIAPYSATLGEQMQGQLTWSVADNGSANANGDWNDEIYLSKNPWLDSSSVLLNQYDAFNNGWPIVGSYGGSYSTDQSGSINIPLNIAPGSYYLILVTDGDGGQGESNSANNDLARPIQILPPDADLQITDATVNGTDLVNPSSTPVLALGQEADLSMTVTNAGGADATNSWMDAVYLSTDDQVDNGDILLGYFDNGNLPAGESYTTYLYSDGNYSIYIPSNIAPGSYDLLFVTDSNNDQPETDETNNIFVAPITIAGPDLAVTAVSAQPISGNIGDQFNAAWTVQNQGEGMATNSGWYDAVYVSTSPTFSYSTAIYVGEQYNSIELNAGDSYNQNLTFTMPGGLGGAGNVYVYVLTDSGNYLPETNENNNISAPFTVNVTGGPDLQVQNFALNSITPLPPVVNGTVSVSWNDANTGTSTANASYWYDFVYISPSSTFDLSQAIAISSIVVYPGGLAAGSSEAQSTTANIPSYLAAGDYWLYIYTDVPNYYNGAYGYQAETNETNNVSTGIEVNVNRPDLTVTTANVDTTALAEGQSTNVEWTIKNTDPTYSVAGNWADAVYISSTPDLTGAYHAYLTSGGPGANSPLGPGGSYDLDQNVIIPTGVVAGNYYLVFVTDVSNNVGETNENNNLFAVPITVSNPDMTVTSLSVSPNPVSVSDNLTVTYTVKNLASTPAYGPWYDAVWLSLDGQIDSQSVALGDIYEDGSNGSPVLQPAGTVGAGGTDLLDQYTVSQAFTIPSWVAEGNYTVIVETDGGYAYNYYNYSSGTYYNQIYSNNLVSESNENNNIATTAVHVGQPDLTVTNAVAPTTANSGDTIPVSFTVTNLDTVAPAGAAWYDGVYLSSTPTLTGNSTLLKSWYHDPTLPLAADGSYNTDDSVTIPENAGPSTEYLIFVTDIYNYQTESNESNNTQTLPITVSSPDLTVINPAGPAQAIIGTYVSISWTTKNIGTTPANGPWYDNVYISTDGSLDGNSTYLGQIYAGNATTLPLAGGASYDTSINAYIPTSYADGNATIFIVTDYYGQQGETNENNNVASFSINIVSPDLVVSSASADTVALQAQTMHVSWTVTNAGTSTAPNAWYDRVSISPDSNPADAVYTVDVANAGDLAAGGSYSLNNFVLTLPTTLATGTYHVLITTDYYSQQPETNEINNTTDAGTVSVIAPDLTVTGAVAGETTNGTAGGLTGYYYGTGSGGAGSVANAQAYIASHLPLAQFVATQVQYPAGQGVGASDGDGDTFGNFLGSDANTLNNPSVKSNTLSGQIIEFDGFVSLPAGNTTLWLGSDDGSELFLNGSTTPLINDDGSHGFAWTSGTYDAPTAGLYAVKIVYFEGGVSTGVGLAWNDSQGNRVTIPTGDLFSSVSTVIAGNSVDLSWTVSNIGTTTATSAWTDRISISPDDNPADAIYSFDVPNNGNLAAGSSYSVDDFLLNLPNTLAQGTYHVLVTTDADNTQLETNEDNNIVDAGLISIDATDLTVTNPSGPTLAVIGAPAAITWTTQNIGNYPATGPWVDNVYISADGQFSDATLLGQVFSNSLPAGTLPLATGGQYTATGNFTIPSNTPTGSYTVFVVTDAYNQVPETNENNNVASFTMNIGAPDLKITSASADATANIGTNMNVAWTVSNDGSSAAPDNWKDTVYLTPDGNIADAVYHADFNHTGGLSASDSYSNSQVLSIPLSLTTGTYSVVIVVDSANAQPETDETNNSYTVGVVNVVAPDLTITASAPSTVTPGGIAAISWTVKNTGGGATISNWYDQVYISSDSTLDANAVYLGSFNAPALTAGASYTQSKDLTIPASTASGNQYIIIITDYGNTVVETNESNNTYSVPLTVAPVNVSVGDTSVAEGDSGTTEMTFTVTLSAATGSTTSVSYSTSNGTATAGSDYQGISGQLVFAPGVTTQQITVPVYGDQSVEDNETVEMELSNPVGLTLGTFTATGTILNDDFGGSIYFDSAAYSTPEGNSGAHNVTITVDRTGGNAAGVSVPYSVSAGTATDGSDFASTSGTLNFAANQSSATFNVLVYGDTVYESDETINLSLGTPTTAVAPADSTAVAALGSPSTSVLTILNDDAEPAITISNVSANEGNSGFTPFTFTVTLSNTSQSPVTVNYATADNTATVADNDYQATSGTLTFTPGTNSQSVTVEVVGDTTQESDETFFVNLTSPSGATLSSTQGTGTIVNDDTDVPPTIVSLQNISGLRKGGIIASADFNLSKPGRISDPSTWAPNFITLTLNGASVDTSSLTIVSDDSNGDYTINGLGALTTTPGLYVLTLDASAVTDDQGVHGVGTASDTFTIDTAPSVSINHPSQSGGVGIYTDTGSFTDPDGSAGDSWTATVDYGDGSGPQSLTLSGMNFSLSHDYTGAGNYTATVIVTDSVGKTGSDTEQFNIVNAPTITSLSTIPAIVTGGVASVDVTFSQPINIATLKSAVTLRRGGTSISNTSITVADDGGNTYTINGLAPLTSAFGAYVLTIDATAVQNTVGVSGTGSASDSWQEDTAPTITSAAFNGAGIPTNTTSSGAVQFSDPNPSPDAWTGTINFGDGSATTALSPASGQAFTFGHAYGSSGSYTATVIVTDQYGLSDSEQFSVNVQDRTTITLLQSISGLQGTAISSVNFSLSNPGSISDPSTWAANFISLRRGGASVSTSSLSIVSDDSNGDYTINGLGALTDVPGQYVLTLDASAVTDIYGIQGTGTASDTWTRDTAPSVSITSPTVTGGVGIVLSDTGSFADPDGPAGDSWTATVDYGDGTAPQALTLAGNDFTLSHSFTSTGDYTATVVVTDSVGETGTIQAAFDVVNGPTIVTLQSISGVLTAGVPSVDVTFSQPIDISTLNSSDITLRRNGASVSTLSVSVTSDGGDTYTIGGLSALTSAFGAYQLTINAAGVQNLDGVAGSGSASDQWQEDTVPSISNVSVNSNYIAVGSSLTGTMSFTDPDPSPTDSWTGTVNYGEQGESDQPLVLNADQSFDFNHVYNTPGVYAVTLTVTDAFGESAVASFDVHVEQQPTITNLESITSPQTGGVQSVDVTFSEPINIATLNSSDILIRRGGISIDASSLTVTAAGGNTYTIGNLGSLTGAFGFYTLTIDAASVQNLDGISGTGSASDSWQEDTAPIATTTHNTASVVEGSVFSDTGSFTDPDSSPPDSWTATVNYGDGVVEPLTLSGKNFDLSHTFSSYGLYDVQVDVTDAYGLSSTIIEQVTVTQTPATITLPADAKVNINTPLSFNGTAVNSNPNDPPFTLSVDYGDGTGAHTLAVTGGNFTFTPDYTQAGRYTVVVTATDQDGTTSSNSMVIDALPNVRPIVVNDGFVERSKVSSVTVSFDDNVNVSNSSFTVLNTKTNATVPYTIQQIDGKTYKLVFTTLDAGGSIADGHYSVTVNSANVTDSAGDTLISDNTQTFWRRFGDFYGNGYVTLADVNLMKSLQGVSSGSPSYNAALDYDGNGTLNSTDLLQLMARYGITNF